MTSSRKMPILVGTAGAIILAVGLSACSSSTKSTAASGTPSGASSSASATAAAGTCTPKHAGLKTVKTGTLTVSAYVSPPYTVQNGSKIDGIDGQIMQALAPMECLKLDAKSVAGAALPASVQSKRADLAIGGVYYNKDRAALFSLTSQMYQDGMSILSKSGVNSMAGLSGKKIGVIQGYLWNAELQKALGAGNVKTYQTSDALIADIKNGRVDAGAFTSAEAGYRAKKDTSLKSALIQSTPKILESNARSNCVLLVTKSETALSDALSADIQVLIKNGSIAKILSANGVDPSLVAKAS